jgi:predicted ATPase
MSARAAFAGRVEELQRLFQALSSAGRLEPRIVLIDGAKGSGRSTLLDEFTRRIADRGREVLVVSVAAPAEGTYDPIEIAAREATNKQVYERVGGRRKALASARDLLPDWLSAIPVVGDLIAAIAGTVQALRDRRRRKSVSPISGDDGTDALIDAGARRTVVLLLDELEKADRFSVARMEALVRAAEGRARLLVVGTCAQPAPGTRPPPVLTMLDALPPSMVVRLTLREMDAGELSAWLRRRFPHVEIPASFLEWLREGTGGHPAAVEETLDRLISRSVIRFANRRWEVGEIPVELPAQRASVPVIDLGGIKPAVVELLEIASTVGMDFDSLTLSHISGHDELYVEDQLAQALHQRLIEANGEIDVGDDIATRYRFRSAHLRSVLLRSLPGDRRSELARLQTAGEAGG